MTSNPAISLRFYTNLRDVPAIVGSLAIYAAVYQRDVLGNLLSGTTSTLLLLAGTAVLLFGRGVRFSHFDLGVLVGFITLTVINSSMSDFSSFSNYLIAPVIAFFISRSGRSIFVRLILIHAVASIAVQAYEHYAGAYVFSVYAEDGSLLDDEYFAGHAGIMRAKGLFQGPLSAVAFYILVALIAGKTRFIAVAIAGAVLAYGRLGIVVTISLLAYRILKNKGSIYRFGLVSFAFFVLAVAPELIILPSFFSAAFDIASSGNSARIYYWMTNIAHFLNYPAINVLFGDLGYANRVIGSTESDFLRILMDAGLVSFALYLGLMSVALRKAARMDYENIFHFFIIAIAMSIFPFIQSLNATLLFWVYIWGFLEKKRGSAYV